MDEESMFLSKIAILMQNAQIWAVVSQRQFSYFLVGDISNMFLCIKNNVDKRFNVRGIQCTATWLPLTNAPVSAVLHTDAHTYRTLKNSVIKLIENIISVRKLCFISYKLYPQSRWFRDIKRYITYFLYRSQFHVRVYSQEYSRSQLPVGVASRMLENWIILLSI